MADSVIDLLFRIKKAGAGGKEGEKELNALGASAKRVKQEFKDFKVIGQAFNASMSLVTSGLKAVTDSAEHLGRTELKKAFAEASEAGQDLQDTLVTLKIGGRDSISWVTDAASGLKNLADLVNISGIAFAQMTGAMSDSEAAARATALVYEDVKLTTEQLAQAQIDLKDPLDESARANREYKTDAENAAAASALAAQKAYDHQLALEKLIGPASDLAFGMGELTTATLYNQAAMGLDEKAAYALAVKMGLIDPAAAGAKTVLDELRIKLDEGKISTGEYTTNIGLLDAAIRTMPDGKTITVEIFEQYRQQYIQDFNAENSGQGGTESGQVGGAQGDGYSSGGDFIVPPGYPNDSYPMRVQSGERVIVQTPEQQRNSTTNMGGVTINIMGGDPYATAREVKRQLENAGRNADLGSRI